MVKRRVRTSKREAVLRANKKKKGFCSGCGKQMPKLCPKCWFDRYCEDLEDGSFVLKKPDN